jgi:hypothetical protein
MATYYVANYGSNSNNGTTPSTPWQTVQFAVGAASGTNPGLTAGDIVWVAPGTYREIITSTTLTGTSGNTIKIYGDPTFTRAWTSGSAGRVRLTNYTTDTALPTGSQTLAILGDYVDIQDLCIDGNPTGTVTGNVITEACLFLRGGNLSVTRCVVQTNNTNRQVGIEWYCATGKKTLLLDRCTVFSSFCIWNEIQSQTATYDVDTTIRDCVVISSSADFGIVVQAAAASQVTGAKIYNNAVFTNSTALVFNNIGQVSGTSCVVRNNYLNGGRGSGFSSSTSITITQSNNTVIAASAFSNISPTTNNLTAPMFDFASSRLQGFNMYPWFAPAAGSPLISAGTATGAPTVDLYGNTWTTTPTIGAIESKTESDVGSYLPTERNASTITIAPASTSQSIELYLGVTGLTFATSGLAAYYVRNQSAPVAITLVTQTPTGAWASGGFAEISSSLVPGVYRLDVPNAAFAAGASDVTIVVRGASGTNGAVVNIRLNQLNVSQLLNTQAGIYTSPGTLGARLLQTVGDNRPVIVTSANQIQVDAGQTFSSGSGTTILDPILNSVGRWTLEGSTLTLYNADGTYLRRCNLSQLGLSLSPT